MARSEYDGWGAVQVTLIGEGAVTWPDPPVMALADGDVVGNQQNRGLVTPLRAMQKRHAGREWLRCRVGGGQRRSARPDVCPQQRQRLAAGGDQPAPDHSALASRSDSGATQRV